MVSSFDSLHVVNIHRVCMVVSECGRGHVIQSWRSPHNQSRSCYTELALSPQSDTIGQAIREPFLTSTEAGTLRADV